MERLVPYSHIAMSCLACHALTPPPSICQAAKRHSRGLVCRTSSDDTLARADQPPRGRDPQPGGVRPGCPVVLHAYRPVNACTTAPINVAVQRDVTSADDPERLGC